MFLKYKRIWSESALKSSYDLVIVGGVLHGLATAYYLARDHGTTNVAILEKRYIGSGGSGRNTAIVRANQRTQENIRLYGVENQKTAFVDTSKGKIFTPRVLNATG